MPETEPMEKTLPVFPADMEYVMAPLDPTSESVAITVWTAYPALSFSLNEVA